MGQFLEDKEKKRKKDLPHQIFTLKIICGTKPIGIYGTTLKKILRYDFNIWE